MERIRVLCCLMLALLLSASRMGASQNPVIPAGDPQKMWAVVVGVSKYTHAEPLKYAASDAVAFGEFLTSPRGGGILPDHLTVLTEENASRVGVIRALGKKFAEKVRPGDTVYVFVAGHGFTESKLGYFVPADGDLEDIETTGVSLRHLKDLVEVALAHAQVKLMFTDICNAGRVGVEKSDFAKKIENIVNEELLGVSTKAGTFLNFVASEPTEYSWESDELKSGVFTHALLDALNGRGIAAGQGVAAARSVVDFVRSEVPKRTANSQHPRANESFDPGLALAFLDRPGPSPRPGAPETTLAFVNAERAPFARVEWLDPATQAKAIRALQKTAGGNQIGALAPGDLELRLYDAENRDRPVRVRLATGPNTFDLVTMNLSQNAPTAGVVQVASLAPMPPPQALPAAAASATLFLRADAQTATFVDSIGYGNGDANGRLVGLSGLTEGVHTVRIVPAPDRERRFRVKLFQGQQILNVENGEIQYRDRIPTPPTQITIPGGLGAQAQQLYQQFYQALWEERLVTPAGNSAWDYFTQMQPIVPADIRDNLAETLLTAMGNRAQQTVLKYIRGGDIRWSPQVFDEGAQLTARVRQLLDALPEFTAQENFFLGRALIERGQYAQAVAPLQQAIAARAQANAYHALGLSFWKQNLLAQAIPPLQQASTMSPRWNYPRNTLALIYLEQRRYGESEQTFQASLQANPEDSTAHHGLAQLYFLQGRLNDTEPNLQRAIEFNPGNAYAHNTYGKLYQRRGQLAEAEQMFRLAIRLEPDEPAFRVSLADLQRAQNLPADAQGTFAQVANQAPTNTLVLERYADFLADQRKEADGRRLFDQAMKQLPRDAMVRVLYGNFLRKVRKDKDAENQYKAAVTLSAANVYAHHELASLYLAQRKTAEAEKELALAIQADPRFGAPPRVLGQIRFAQKRFEEALAEFRKAADVTIEPAQKQELQELIASAEKSVAETKAANARGWSDLVAALKVTPNAPELKRRVLQFQLEHPTEADVAMLPQSLQAAMNTSFWKAHVEAESIWRAGQRDTATALFRKTLEGLSPAERRIVAGTAFNLRNDEFGIHQIVYRWARRYLDNKQYREALALMDVSTRHWIFAAVPDFSPLTLDALMWPDDAADAKNFTDFEVALHPDPRPHEIYAAAYAGLRDSESMKRYIAAIEGPPQYLMLSAIQCGTGDCAAARQTLQQGRKLFPKSKEIEDALRRIR